MKKKFTRAMVCEEFKSTCGKCPLHSSNSCYGIPCWLLDEDEIQVVMKDYPYTDVKAKMIFKDFETRLTAVEEKVEKKAEPKFTMFEVVAKKLYDKLEAKHEADCRLISEYDLEIKKLKEQNDAVCDLYSKLHTEQKERVRCEAVIVDKNQQIDEWKKRYERLRGMDKKRFFDSKNTENERDHYKGLYSSKCDDYDKLLEKQLKTEKELKHAEEVGDRYKSLYDTTCDNYEKLYEENNKLIKENKTFNVLLINKTETIGKLGDEYDKLKEQNSILTKENKKLTESNNNHATDNVELEGENDALSTRNAFLEDKIEAQKNRIINLESKLRNQRANLTSLQEKYESATEQKDHYKNLFHSLNHNYQNLVGEMKNWKERATTAEKELDYLKMKNENPSVIRMAFETENNALRTACENRSEAHNKLKSEYYIIKENLKITEAALKCLKEKLKETEEKLNDARVLNKMREEVFEANIKLQKIIEAKDREIGLLRAELDKYTPDDDDECDDRWID